MISSSEPKRAKTVFVNRFFHPDESATSQMLTGLAIGLAARGVQVHVLCSRQLYSDPASSLPKTDIVSGVVVHRIWTTRFGRDRLLGRAIDYATYYLSCAVALLRILKSGDCVVAMTDPPLVSIVAMAAAKIKGARLINWLQDIFPEVASHLGANPLPRILDSILRAARNSSLRVADCNVVLGRRMRALLLEFGVPTERIRIVENWAESDSAPPKPANRSELRLRSGLLDSFVVGYSGNLGRAHEYDTLLAAAESLRSDPTIVFLMIGAGAGMIRLKEAVNERRLGNFRFLPYQPRETLADSLAAADVHWVSLIPALEGLIVPSKFYGILAAARPVIFIGDPDGELAVEICESRCGYAVRPGDVGALVGALIELRDEARFRLDLGRNAYLRYCERFSAGRAQEQWFQLVRDERSAASPQQIFERPCHQKARVSGWSGDR